MWSQRMCRQGSNTDNDLSNKHIFSSYNVLGCQNWEQIQSCKANMDTRAQMSRPICLMRSRHRKKCTCEHRPNHTLEPESMLASTARLWDALERFQKHSRITTFDSDKISYIGKTNRGVQPGCICFAGRTLREMQCRHTHC